MNNIIECPFCGNKTYSAFIVHNQTYICRCCGVAHHQNAVTPEMISEMTDCKIAYNAITEYDFGNAIHKFYTLIEKYPRSIAAKWGYLLAKYGIVYIPDYFKRDPKTKIVPSTPIYCFPYYSNNRTFTEEDEYKSLMDLLSQYPKDKEFYQGKASEIEAAVSDFNANYSQTEYDIFMCVKISKTTRKKPNEVGQTEDFNEARKLYQYLTEKCKKTVFFSFYTLGNQPDSDMKIWPALLKSKKMLLIGSSEEYLNSHWVKSEWQRWLHLDQYDNGARKNNLYIYTIGKHESAYSLLPFELQSKNFQIYTELTYEQLKKDLCQDDFLQKEKIVQTNGKIVSRTFEQPLTYGMDAISENFVDPNDITEVYLPESIKTIEANAFQNCKNFRTLYISENVKRIGENAFLNCPNLTITYNGTKRQWKKLYASEIKSQDTYEDEERSTGLVGHYRKINCLKKDGWLIFDNGTQAVIPHEATIIKDRAYCEKKDTKIFLVKAVLHTNLTVISEHLFENCTHLREVVIPESITVIGQSAFQNCKTLNKIFLPDRITYIGTRAFANCENLQEIKIPNSVTEIGTMAFANCVNMETAVLSECIKNIASKLFYNCEQLQEIKIPQSVTAIGADAFHYCKNLKTIRLPSKLTRIEYGTFGSCTNLEKVEIPEGVTHIERAAFEKIGSKETDESYDSVIVDETVTKNHMAEVIIPESVVSIEPKAFFDSKIKIVYAGSPKQWADLKTDFPANQENIVYRKNSVQQTQKTKERSNGKKKSNPLKIVLSILLILALLGMIAWGFLVTATAFSITEDRSFESEFDLTSITCPNTVQTAKDNLKPIFIQ